MQYLQKKTGTTVRLDRISIGLPRDISLEHLYVEDLNGDTLLFAKKLEVDVQLFKLIQNKLEIQYLGLEKIRANISRKSPDTTFNFSFLMNAFMSEQEKPEEKIEKDSTATLKFAIDRIKLEDIGIAYRDDLSGNEALVRLGLLDTRLKVVDPEQQQYAVRKLLLSNTSVKYAQKNMPELAPPAKSEVATAKTAAAILPTIAVDDFAFKNVKVDYDDQQLVIRTLATLQDLTLKGVVLDLNKNNYAIEEIAMKNNQVAFGMKPSEKVPDTSSVSAPLSVKIGKINLSNNDLMYDVIGAKRIAKGMDFNHLALSDLHVDLRELVFNPDKITANVRQVSLKEKSGFIIEKLKGEAIYTSKQMALKNFEFRTPHTRVINETDIRFDRIEDLTKHPERVELDLHFDQTTLGIQDASFFSQTIPSHYLNEKIKLNAQIKGKLSDFSINQLQLQGLKNLQADMQGRVVNVMDPQKAFLDLQIRKLYLSKGDVLALAPPKSLPEQIQLPDYIDARGAFKGSMEQFESHLNVRSDLGRIALNAQMTGGKGREDYQANLQLIDFDAGRLLKQDSLGRVSASAHVKGLGLDPKTLQADIKARIINATYQNYTYRNLLVEGQYKEQEIKVKSQLPDSNLHFNLAAEASLAGKYPAIKAILKLEQADLERLHFSKNELRLAGELRADFSTADPDYLNGTLFATKLQIVKEGKRAFIDTIALKSVASATENRLNLQSDFLKANLEGKYQLSQLGQAVTNTLHRYYSFGERKSISPQRLKFELHVSQPPFLADLLPALKTFKASRISGFLDTEQDSLEMDAVFPKIVYQNFDIDSVRLVIGQEEDKLAYSLGIRQLQSPSIALYRTEVSGEAAENILKLTVFLRDQQLKNKYQIGGTLESLDKNFKFHIVPDQLVLNYDKWKISKDNYLQFGESGILAHQFNLSQNGQALRINSETSRPGAPLEINFRDFELATLFRFAETDSTLLGGRINGSVNASNLTDDLRFEGGLKIDRLRYQKDQLGNLDIKVNNHTANAYEIEAVLSGVHELQAKGFYYTQAKEAFDLQLLINKIQLKELESLSMGQLKQGKGYLSGSFDLKGNTDAPRINGSLKFNDVGFNVAYINSYFTMPNQQIDVTPQSVLFNNFTLIDSLQQKAIINGQLQISELSNMGFNLDVRTQNFRAIHSTAADNEMIYGTVFLTSNIRVRGDMNQPDVNMSVTVNKGTDFYYALPVNDPSVIQQEGIVQFIDADAPPFNGEKALEVDSVSKSPVKGLNLVADITINPEAELSVVVDAENGDMLKVKGNAELNATMDPSGKISLTGRYEMTEGSYNLTVNPLGKRPFTLEKGSSIVWTGEPTAANVNITAVYEVSAAPIDLINDPENMQAKTKLPFQVFLMMKGELMKPDISFKLDLPESQRSALGGIVYTQLQIVNRDENELNKQVFALLALNRFMANNPFQSLAGGGGGVSSYARSSVSKLLTEQLNNLASDLIQGVELNFDVNSSEDYSSGSLEQKTDLEVGLSKRLLNDRLTVTVGSSFAIEGGNNTNNTKDAANIAGNVNVEYALSADGKYRLRAYRRNQNESVIDGQIIETGLGFTIVVDYNRFREIFQNRSKRWRNQMEQRPRNESNQ